MKQLPNETYEQWVKRVEQYEFGRALMELAKGADPEQVMEQVSYRIMKKLQHPIIQAINATVTSSYNSEQSLDNYRKNYQDRFGPKSDHIKDK